MLSAGWNGWKLPNCCVVAVRGAQKAWPPCQQPVDDPGEMLEDRSGPQVAAGDLQRVWFHGTSPCRMQEGPSGDFSRKPIDSGN